MGRTVRDQAPKAAPHCLVVPFPAHGHLNPMLQFSRRLSHKGIQITLALTHFMLSTMNGGVPDSSGFIGIESFSDGKEEADGVELDFKDYYSNFRRVGSRTLAELMAKLRSSGRTVDCVVYDAFMPWVLDVARAQGSMGAVFFTQSCAVNNIYYHVKRGLLEIPVTGTNVFVGGLPELRTEDLPSFVHDVGSYPGTLEMLVNQFSNVDRADSVLVNTFYELEAKVIDWMQKHSPLKTIGPTIPSMYLDQRLEGDKEYGLHNNHNPKYGDCIKWLDERAVASVVYVSFGTIAELGIEQMEELAWGLRDSNKYFLWVVRETQMTKLPKNFMEETLEKGLVVTWCPQLEVLAHKSIGCFVTHCGWNSTLEALGLGVPLVAMPQWTDQTTNAKCVADVWGSGLIAKISVNEIAQRELMKNNIKEVMEGEKGKEIRRNAMKWKKLATEAVDEGGSSDQHINEFVATLVHF